MTVKERIAQLRAEMDENNIDAFIVYSADPHMSEYLPKEWGERTWISGFTGSAGFVVILKDKAGLWTDGRYFTQAPVQLEGSGIDLFKDGVEGTPNYIDWIIAETPENAKVAVNALTTSHSYWENLQSKLEKKNRELVDLPLLNNVWTDRPAPSQNPIFVHPIERAGQSASDKINAIRQKMKEQGATAHIITSLDDVAWTLNLRGSDVQCNPVFLGYILITLEESILFVEEEKLNLEAQQLLDETQVKSKPYNTFFDTIRDLQKTSVLVSPSSNQAIYEALKYNNHIISEAVPGHLMKAIKNKTELEGFRTVMVKDGVAMVKFLHWITHNVGKVPMTEFSIGEKLESFRAEGENFVGISFDSIVGYNGNGAIVHYKAPEEGSAEVTNKGTLLVDSGGQYLEGTTDITRTFPLEEQMSEDFKRDYTLVLKGHIRLALAKFPKGTRGVQLDAFARLPLWEEGKDYNHGTGHGVGSFMNVHEGPQSIRKDLHPQPLVEGMVLSNEPGYYPVGKYGIRLENLVEVKEWKKTEWNTFYAFEDLTLCPFFKSPIIKELLSKDEIQWLNDYHKKCEEQLAPNLEGKVKDWFLEMVKPL